MRWNDTFIPYSPPSMLLNTHTGNNNRIPGISCYCLPVGATGGPKPGSSHSHLYLGSFQLHRISLISFFPGGGIQVEKHFADADEK